MCRRRRNEAGKQQEFAQSLTPGMGRRGELVQEIHVPRGWFLGVCVCVILGRGLRGW